MKTKELIAKLQEVDPSGELHCCIGNIDIGSIYASVGYWDGCYQVLNYDNKGEIISAEYKSNGYKVVIRTYSIFDVIFDNANIPILFDSDYAKEHYGHLVERYKKSAVDIHNSCYKDLFIRWAKEKYSDYEEVETENCAIQFFDLKLKDTYNNIPEGEGSVADRFYSLWNNTISLRCNKGQWEFYETNDSTIR